MKRKQGKLRRELGYEAVEPRDPPTNLFPIDFDEGNASDWVTSYYCSYGDDDTVSDGNGDDTVCGGG